MSTRTEEFFANVASIPGAGSVKKIVTSGAHVLGLHELNVEVTSDGAADTTITLPDACKAMGMFASVYLTASDGTYDIAVAGPGVGSDYASGDMDGAGEWVLLYSNGFRWLPIADTIP